jgi:methionyl-tRNA synthetase
VTDELKTAYITTPIYYVNDVPHLGTAYTTVVADALTRFQALRGRKARMLTGTDEHGLKIERVAKEQGKAPQAFVDGVSESFREAWPQLSINNADFIRTTEPRHKQFVQDLWMRIKERGHLYLGEYEDWYCVGCESFKTEKELLPEQLCPLHKKPVERVKEQTYFFRLSQFQDRLLAFYESHPQFIRPESRRNEVISFVKSGLLDLSCSRTSFTWGIPVPDDAAHVMYVWFDALTNYLSALNSDEAGSDRRAEFWPPAGRAVHIVGKDIVRFHAVYWPAFLMAAGFPDEALPSTVYAHGFLTVDGEKMSKTLRNAVDPLKIAKLVGPDPLRYYLLRAISFGQDGDFDRRNLLERYNADLGKNLGNLLARTLGLNVKSFGNTVPPLGPLTELETELFAAVSELGTSVAKSWDELEPHRALEATWAISALANQYVDRAAPWALGKKLLEAPGDAEARARLGTILRTLLNVLRMLSALIWPAMPGKSDAMRAQLGLSPLLPKVGHDLWGEACDIARAFESPLAPGAPLFPTYDAASVEQLMVALGGDLASEAVTLTESKPSQALTTPITSPPIASPVSISPTSAAASSGTPLSAVPATENSPTSPITYDQFSAVDLRVGLVVSAEKVPKKDKLLKLAVDLGEAEPRAIIAGLALSFTPETLVGRRVVVVANLAPRDFGKGLISHGMLLASGASESLHLAGIDDTVAPGSKLK